MQALLAVIPLLLSGSIVYAQPSPASVAKLILESDAAIVQTVLPEALVAPSPLVRATAARVVLVRGDANQLPLVVQALAAETDDIAAREQIRALALLGSDEQLATAAAAAKRWPSSMDGALAIGAARRGGLKALQIYESHLRESRMSDHAGFFRTALWGHTDAIPLIGARLIANEDADGWKGLLATLRQSNVAMHGPMMTAALGSGSEPVRAASVWYLTRGYAADPQSIPAVVKEALTTTRSEPSSDREDFGREMLRRMSGGERRTDTRWLRFLENEEADDLFRGEDAILQYLTEEEYALRLQRCEVQIRDCRMPPKPGPFRIPSTPVAPPEFDLPSALPPGLADAILAGERCNDAWIGVAGATVDSAGRVTDLDLDKVQTSKACRRAIETIVRLSTATNTSVLSGFKAPVLLVRHARAGLCLDEDAPGEADSGIYRAGGAIDPPKVRKRFEPVFPALARRMMGGGREVQIVAESVISKSGCVRNIRIVEQSPYGDLNGAALMALSQWTFLPGTLNGQPVDTQFTLTLNYKTR